MKEENCGNFDSFIAWHWKIKNNEGKISNKFVRIGQFSSEDKQTHGIVVSNK